MIRTEGGPQANGHIEINGKASKPAVTLSSRASAPPQGRCTALMLSASDLEGWRTQAFCWGFLFFVFFGGGGLYPMHVLQGFKNPTPRKLLYWSQHLLVRIR